MVKGVFLELSYHGEEANAAILNFYDAAQALAGFERTISLTYHLLLNAEVLTQSPSAKGFDLYLEPPQRGSWKAVASIAFGSALTIGVASKDSALGYLGVSALDYILQETLGFEVDFERTLGRQLEEARRQDLIPDFIGEDRFDSLIEKVEPSIKAIHRPIVMSETANNAQVAWRTGERAGQLDAFFDQNTFEYLDDTLVREDIDEFQGVISSYNVNTFKGRIFIEGIHRTVPFELGDRARTRKTARLIVGSLYENTSRSGNFNEKLTLTGYRRESINGRLKSVLVIDVSVAR